MKKILLIVVTIILICGVTKAQNDSTSVGNRKKVAVVLSGGGAKGMAHIGVLKVLERANIPIGARRWAASSVVFIPLATMPQQPHQEAVLLPQSRI